MFQPGFVQGHSMSNPMMSLDTSMLGYHQYGVHPVGAALSIAHSQPVQRHLESPDIHLEIIQQPREALVTNEGKEKARKPVDPPPIIELKVSPNADPHQHFLQSPYLFMSCALINVSNDGAVKHQDAAKQALAGSLVSSLHRLKDPKNQGKTYDGAFFVFGDISVRVVGQHRLQFNLYDFHKETRDVYCLGSIISNPFQVVPVKDFKGMEESTYLSRAFSDQGVRLRLRKEPRAFSAQKRSYRRASPSVNNEEQPSPPLENGGAYVDARYYQKEEDESQGAAKRIKTDGAVEYGYEQQNAWSSFPLFPYQ